MHKALTLDPRFARPVVTIPLSRGGKGKPTETREMFIVEAVHEYFAITQNTGPGVAYKLTHTRSGFEAGGHDDIGHLVRFAGELLASGFDWSFTDPPKVWSPAVKEAVRRFRKGYPKPRHAKRLLMSAEVAS